MLLSVLVTPPGSLGSFNLQSNGLWTGVTLQELELELGAGCVLTFVWMGFHFL